MSISVHCPCGQHFQTRDENAGRRVECRDCGRETTVSTPVPFAADVLFISDDPPGSAGGSEGRGARPRVARKWVVAGTISILLIQTVSFSAALPHWRAARRAGCVNNLKQIGLAMHYYAAAQGHFPAAAITSAWGRPLLSWRVAILPYIGQNALYAKFHLDEPWDSPHNYALIDEMPQVYSCPADHKLAVGHTNYQVVIDPRGIFTPDFKPVTIAEIDDGTSNTLLVGETTRNVPWTAPRDLPFNITAPLSNFGSEHSHHPGVCNLLYADGSVKETRGNHDPRIFEAIVTRAGGEVWCVEVY